MLLKLSNLEKRKATPTVDSDSNSPMPNYIVYMVCVP